VDETFPASRISPAGREIAVQIGYLDRRQPLTVTPGAQAEPGNIATTMIPAETFENAETVIVATGTGHRQPVR
jgi:hypothetical protein